MSISDLLKYLSKDTIRAILDELAEAANDDDDALANSLFERIFYLADEDETE